MSIFQNIWRNISWMAQNRRMHVKSAVAVKPRVSSYPQQRAGYPVVPVEQVIRDNDDLLLKIKNTIGLSDHEFNQIIFPAIYNFTAFVHLLPASEGHHHDGVGGLARHCYEVAYYAAQMANGHVWPTSDNPKTRRDENPRWRVAVMFGGLFHDVGKVLSDMEVSAPDGTVQFNAVSDPSLVDWAQRYDIEEYYIRHLRNRHRKHEHIAFGIYMMLVPNNTRAWLSASSETIHRTLETFLTGHKELDRHFKQFASVIETADARSASESQYAKGEAKIGAGTKFAAEDYIISAIKRLMSDRDWSVNVKGSRVWHTKSGLFITWPQGGNDIYESIKHDKIPGVPKDPEKMARILVDCGYAVEFAADEGVRDYYWPFIPSALSGGKSKRITILHGIKLTHTSLLWRFEPEPIEAIVGDEARKIREAKKQRNDDTNQPQQPKVKKRKRAQSQNQKRVLEDLVQATSNNTPVGKTSEPTANSGPDQPDDGSYYDMIDYEAQFDSPPPYDEVEASFNVAPPVDPIRVQTALKETEFSKNSLNRILNLIRKQKLEPGQTLWLDSLDRVHLQYPEIVNEVFKESAGQVCDAFIEAGYLIPVAGNGSNYFHPCTAISPASIIFSQVISERFPFGQGHEGQPILEQTPTSTQDEQKATDSNQETATKVSALPTPDQQLPDNLVAERLNKVIAERQEEADREEARIKELQTASAPQNKKYSDVEQNYLNSFFQWMVSQPNVHPESVIEDDHLVVPLQHIKQNYCKKGASEVMRLQNLLHRADIKFQSSDGVLKIPMEATK